MAKLYNLARMTTSTAGTGAITLGSAVAGYLSFAGAGIQDGDVVTYAIQDGAASEIGRGTYTASGTTLSRSVLKSTNSNSPISLSGSAQVFITASAEDFGDRLLAANNLSDVDNAATALRTLGGVSAASIAVNLGLAAAAAGNALTISVKGSDGADPSASNLVYIPFEQAPTWRTISSALSITIPSGATLGAVANVPFRLWIAAFDDAGTVRLGVIQRVTGGSTPSAIAAVVDNLAASTTAIDASADNGGVFYTGSAVTDKSFRLLGYVDYESGLATPGTWASPPTTTRLYGPGTPPPGSVVAHARVSSGAIFGTTSSSFQNTNLTINYSPRSPVSPLLITAGGVVVIQGNNIRADVQMARGSTAIGPTASAYATASGNVITDTRSFASLSTLDVPGASPTAYTMRLRNNDGITQAYFAPDTPGFILIEEMQA